MFKYTTNLTVLKFYIDYITKYAISKLIFNTVGFSVDTTIEKEIIKKLIEYKQYKIIINLNKKNRYTDLTFLLLNSIKLDDKYMINYLIKYIGNEIQSNLCLMFRHLLEIKSYFIIMKLIKYNLKIYLSLSTNPQFLIEYYKSLKLCRKNKLFLIFTELVKEYQNYINLN